MGNAVAVVDAVVVVVAVVVIDVVVPAVEEAYFPIAIFFTMIITFWEIDSFASRSFIN